VAGSSTAGQGVERGTSEEEADTHNQPAEADTCMPAGEVDNRPPGPERQGTASVIDMYTPAAVLGHRSKTFDVPNEQKWLKTE